MKKKWMKYYKYLEDLRQSGITNMYGAAPYLQAAFKLTRKEANDILVNWMKNYQEIMEQIKQEEK